MDTHFDYSLPMDRLLQPFAEGRMLRSWKRFTSPVRPLADADRFQEVRVLASLLIGIFMIVLIGAPLHLLTAEVLPGTHVSRLIIHGSDCFLIAICYGLTRNGRTATALILFITSWSVNIYLEAWLLRGTDHYLLLYALILPIIALSLFRSTRSALVLIGLQFIAVLLLPRFATMATSASILPTAFTLVLVSLMFLAITNAGRHVQMAYRASIALREAQYRDLFNSVNDLVVIVSTTGQILQVNHSAQRLLGWEPDDVVGHPFQAYLHPDDLAALTKPFMDGVKTMADGRPSALIEARVCTVTGAYRWLEFNTTPHVVNGAVTMFTTTARDIGERKQAEANRLKMTVEREKWDLLQKFVISVSHDFRTSLSNIETNRYLIERALKPEQRETLSPRMDVIRKQVIRLNEQLENLQFMTSLKASRTVPVNIASIACQVVNDLALAALEKQVKIVTQIESESSLVNGDSEYLYRAMRHLVSNAISASNRGGQIEVALKQAQGSVIVQTHNGGPQILPADLERIFEPFYRIDDARQISKGGIGIGLTLVKMVAETYGGSVMVESNPECGTLFTFRLPALAASVASV